MLNYISLIIIFNYLQLTCFNHFLYHFHARCLKACSWRHSYALAYLVNSLWVDFLKVIVQILRFTEWMNGITIFNQLLMTCFKINIIIESRKFQQDFNSLRLIIPGETMVLLSSKYAFGAVIEQLWTNWVLESV